MLYIYIYIFCNRLTKVSKRSMLRRQIIVEIQIEIWFWCTSTADTDSKGLLIIYCTGGP